MFLQLQLYPSIILWLCPSQHAVAPWQASRLAPASWWCSWSLCIPPAGAASLSFPPQSCGGCRQYLRTHQINIEVESSHTWRRLRGELLMSCNWIKSKLIICILHVQPQKSENVFKREERLRAFGTSPFNVTHLTKTYHSLTKNMFLRNFLCNIILWSIPLSGVLQELSCPCTQQVQRFWLWLVFLQICQYVYLYFL